MTPFHTADCETNPFDGESLIEPFTFGHYTGDYYVDFWGDDCIEQYVEFIYTLDSCKVYFHNGGKFDLLFLLPYVDENLQIINGRIAKCTIGNVTFLDSFLLLPLPLSAHEKDEFDYSILTPEKREEPNNKAKIRIYQQHDCLYLYDWLSKFNDRFGLPLTLPKVSFNELKNLGYDIDSSSEKYDDHFRQFYYGGRTDARLKGVHRGDFKYYDINSAYSKSMQEEHPKGLRYDVIDYIPDNQVYFAHIKAISQGALPFRGEDEKGNPLPLSYPEDYEEREYFVTGYEIRAGLDTKTLKITEVIAVYVHRETQNFKTYTDKYFEEKRIAKENGDKDGETFAKLLLNTPYGRLALDPRKYKFYQITTKGFLPPELWEYYQKYNVNNIDELKKAILYDDFLTDKQAEKKAHLVSTWEVVQDLECGLTIWQRDDPGEHYYNVATAASITGWVRAFLWRTICASTHVMYCDTDSIMCLEFGGVIGDKLGEWKLEADLDEIYIGGKKLYCTHVKGTDKSKMHELVDRNTKNWKTASKGSRLTPGEIISIVEFGYSVEWEPIAPSFSIRYGQRYIPKNIKKT